MTWGVEGRSLAVEGEGFVNVPLFLCKYRGDRGKPLRGEFFSSRLITCPLGSSLQNDATGEVEKVQLYISMDEGERLEKGFGGGGREVCACGVSLFLSLSHTHTHTHTLPRNFVWN